MLRHIVLLTWIDGTTLDDVGRASQALSTLPEQIDSIRRYTFGPDLGLAAGRWDYAIVADFDDVDGWATYDTHPAHEQVLADVLVPLIAQRASVQFEPF